ncbi:MAG: serine hydrolase domain-containing protein [Burkholderiaceae bacterium]
MTEGFAARQFAAVRDAFARSFADGLEHGAAVALWVDGQPVVDLWGGHCDLSRTRPWQRDTLVNVWSCSKGVAATAVAMLVERGKLAYEAPVARYWPEFAANGKGAITLDQVLSHQAGLDGVLVDITLEDLYKGKPFVDALAAMAPLWAPGSRCVYHPVTFGHLLGEVVRRVEGRSLGQFIAEEISAPLGLSYFVGLPAEQEHRVAQMSGDDKIYEAHVEGEKGPYPYSFRNPELFAETPNARSWRAAEIPAANGHADARSLATMYATLALGGEMNGCRLISAQGIARAAKERFRGVDACSLGPTVFAAGYRVDSIGFGGSVGAGNFGHTGWGGSVAFADPGRRLGFAFVTNRLLAFDDGVDPRRQRLLDAVYAAL